jgi:pantoate--beta-alanine ligase
MQIFHSQLNMGMAVAKWRREGKKIGFVPTMGALHQGHASLVREARKQNDIVVCSIFVNPTQFNNASDLASYPRTPERDYALVEHEGCDAIYTPEVRDLYPSGTISEYFELGDLERVMEGEFRPGHFQGVATVVKRLFAAVQPHKAYFGEKDYQQLLIIKKLAQLENFDVEIIGCTAVREPDGLALSSRNMRLSPSQRMAAPAIFEALQFIRSKAKSTSSVEKAIGKAIEIINNHPDLAVEYVSVANARTLQPIASWDEAEHARAFAAVFAGEVRLIDNIALY